MGIGERTRVWPYTHASASVLRKTGIRQYAIECTFSTIAMK